MAHLRTFAAAGASVLLAALFQLGCSSDSASWGADKSAGNSNESAAPVPGEHFGSSSTGAGGGAEGTGGSSSSGGFNSTGSGGGPPGGGGGSGTSAAVPGVGQTNANVKAGEWDDNANYREFLEYLKKSQSLPYSRVDVSRRQFIVVEDSAGRAVADCPIVVSDGTHSTTLKTMPAGRTPLFPNAVGLVGDTFSVQATCAAGTAQGTLDASSEDNVVVLKLAAERAPIATKSIELAFILDTTGSMSEEIEAIKSTVSAVADKLTPQQGISLRVGLVAYKDYVDSAVYVTKTFPFDTDIPAFRASIAGLTASGGGDIPEAVNEALHVTGQLDWRDDAFARFAFLVADAPPHTNEKYDYALEAKSFLSRGIQVFTVSASGQDDFGQLVFRQIAQYTYATNMFVLRGGAGPQSTGGGDPMTSCGTRVTSYASGNLDDLIVKKVLDEVDLYDRDPMQIPGLKTDAQIVSCPDAGVLFEASDG
jgi:hypothetical protein